jgi:UPF0271 protein
MIDFNCDVGEGIANEHLLMPHITSCNIACGGHFGDENSIDKTILLALKNNVLIGAHPSFPDKENFGRKWMHISDEDLFKSIQYQMDLFLKRMSLHNARLHHIKPHGALYNAIAIDENLAKIFVKSILKYSKNIFLYVPYQSEIEKVAINNDIKIIYEAFADRNYNDDLTLVNRAHENAIIKDKEAVFQHVSKMLIERKVKTISGKENEIKVATFCVHSDTENAVEIVKYISEKLKNQVSA